MVTSLDVGQECGQLLGQALTDRLLTMTSGLMCGPNVPIAVKVTHSDVSQSTGVRVRRVLQFDSDKADCCIIKIKSLLDCECPILHFIR